LLTTPTPTIATHGPGYHRYVIHVATGEGCLVVSHALVVMAVLPPLQFQTLTDVTKLACLGVVMIVLVLALYFSQLGTKVCTCIYCGVAFEPRVPPTAIGG
jgi:hypothetical protein